ncbi:hypothetical protein H6F43_12510, partial [Leptolyngbya sp. FACHB-36]|nr:hypothetical protein [Leptolyngbya sp. FACHB-36]
MTHDPLLFFDDFPEPAPFRGMAIADILDLPDDLQPLAAWLVRQSEVNWAQAVEYLEGDEVEAQAQLAFLVQRGFVQELRDDLNRRFRTRLDRRRSSEAPESIGQPFAPEHVPEVTCTLAGEQSVVVGESVDVRVTVSNPGSQSAVVNVYLDETSQPVVQWCPMPQDRLVLGPRQSGEVVFQVQVPPQALPSVYDYCLVVETPNHSEDLPRRYRQRLHVLPMQSIARLQDPTFAIQPATRADHPAVLQPGQILEMVVLVQNASDHVDRFRLTCPDFSPEWVTVRYPQELDLADLIQETDGVSINPGANAQIMLLIHPPLEATAGDYSSTLRLHSANQPDVMLLDVVHLQLQPIYALHLELRTIRGTVRQGAGQFSLRLLNDGNTDRELRMRTSSNEWFRYRLEPSSWMLPPKTAATAELTVQPRKGWRRPLLGAGRLIPFEIEIEDVQQRPLESDRLRGAFVWEPRPGWQVLLLVLAAVGTVGTLAAVLWLAFFKPIALPKIAEFASESTTYDAATGETIRLRWQVGNPEQLEALRLSSLSPQGTAIGNPTLYDFRQGIPAELQPFCTLQQVLTCKGVETNVGAAGNYVFELAAISKQSADPAEIQKTPTIAILPP